MQLLSLVGFLANQSVPAKDRSKVLRLRMRLAAREIARQAWVKSHGRGDDARLLFESNERIQKFSPAIILLMLQLAITLWQWWKDRGIDEPSAVASMDEPVDWSDDDE